MGVTHSPAQMIRAARQAKSQSDLSIYFKSLSIQSRPFCSTSSWNAVASLHAPSARKQATPDGKNAKGTNYTSTDVAESSPYKDMSPAQRAARAAERARTRLQEQQQKYTQKKQLGGLADNSFFAERKPAITTPTDGQSMVPAEPEHAFAKRTLENMSLVLNPRPNARARWQKKMLVRHIRRRGRLPKVVQIARTERDHLSKSHFFKTSMKKLAPLARQIAGKPIDEAILQMRFSKKKAARDVRAHLIQARDEAIVMKGMGLNLSSKNEPPSDSPVLTDPGITPPSPHQNPTKSVKDGFEKHETDMYVAQAWVNRGPYGMEPEYRARGRVNILRPPWTGISVLLKEEKTRTRERADKEAKVIRKRLGKNMWTQLPDRPITRQSQYVLW